MTPKEKAKELIDKYQIAGSIWYVDRTKNYALIAVDEMYNIAHNLDDMATVGYLIDVKNEIEKA